VRTAADVDDQTFRLWLLARFPGSRIAAAADLVGKANDSRAILLDQPFDLHVLAPRTIPLGNDFDHESSQIRSALPLVYGLSFS